jgi:hypothetical protein
MPNGPSGKAWEAIKDVLMGIAVAVCVLPLVILAMIGAGIAVAALAACLLPIAALIALPFVILYGLIFGH